MRMWPRGLRQFKAHKMIGRKTDNITSKQDITFKKKGIQDDKDNRVNQ